MSTSPVVSEIFTTAVVVLVEVVSSDLAPATRRVGPAERSGTVQVEVVEVVIGTPGTEAGQRLRVPVTVGGVAGLWSAHWLTAGTRLVAFCDAGTTSETVLAAEHCARLRPAGEVLDDVRLVARLRRRHPTADQLLAAAEQHRGDAGDVFARYVWVAAREALRTGGERFDRLMRVAEDPDTRAEAQEAYLVCAYEDITFTETFPAEHRARLARAMLRSSLDERLGARRHDLLAVYLPNLLSVPEPLTADAVLDPDPALRDRVRAELADPRDPMTTSPALRAWLGEG